MLVGHLAVAFALKRVEPRLSLGTLVLAALLADLLWCIFLLAGLERVIIRQGLGAANYIALFDVPYSHSLMMTIVWGGLFAAIHFLRKWSLSCAAILFFVVLTHWVLDVVTHKAELALAPGVQGFAGLGLWSSMPATLAVEGGMWLIALIIFVHSTRAKKLFVSFAFWGVVALLTLAWYNNIAGPPPPDPTMMGITSLMFFSLITAWAYWINHARPMATSETKVRVKA